VSSAPIALIVTIGFVGSDGPVCVGEDTFDLFVDSFVVFGLFDTDNSVDLLDPVKLFSLAFGSVRTVVAVVAFVAFGSVALFSLVWGFVGSFNLFDSPVNLFSFALVLVRGVESFGSVNRSSVAFVFVSFDSFDRKSTEESDTVTREGLESEFAGERREPEGKLAREDPGAREEVEEGSSPSLMYHLNEG
jgi:hypothetical protein